MAHLNKKTDNYDPGILSVILDPETNEYIYVSINNNIMKHDDSLWSWDALEIPDFALYAIHNADDDTKYKVLIAHIVKAYYDANDEMAVIANYIGNPEKRLKDICIKGYNYVYELIEDMKNDYNL